MLCVDVTAVIGLGGLSHSLGNAHRRIISELVKLHQERPMATLSVHELVKVGWPGERILVDAGLNRVYVALTHLRKRGLNRILERHAGGYRLAPTTRVLFNIGTYLPNQGCALHG
jgi:hypothetical protein